MDIKNLTYLASQNLTLKQIASKLNLSISCVSKNIKKHNIIRGCDITNTPDRDPNIYEDYSNPIVSDFVNGMTQKEIAQKYKKSPKAINSYLKRRKINKLSHPLLNDKKWLILKLKEGKSLNNMANELNIHYDHVNKAYRKFNISKIMISRWKAEAISGQELKKEEIEKLYNVDCLSTLKIAKLYGYKSDDPIRRYMRDVNIYIRKDGEHQLKHDNPKWLLSKLENYAYIYDLYIIQFLSSNQIANILKTNGSLVLRYLKRHKIPLRNTIDYAHIRDIRNKHRKVIEKLNKNEIVHETSYIYRGRYNRKNRKFEIDEYFPQLKIFMEIQGEHWHGLKIRHWKYKRVRAKMWSDLIKYLCITRDYPDHRFLYVTENEIDQDIWYDRIFKKYHKSHFNFSAYTLKKCKYEELKNFIKDNHYLGSMSRGRYYGLFLKDQIKAAAVISHPTRNEIRLSNGDFGLEITRLVAKDLPRNGLSFFLGYVLKTEKKHNKAAGIIAFADPSPYLKGQHFGSIYRATNFKLIKITSWNYKYADNKGNILHKKTLYNRAKKLNLKEKEYAIKFNWHKIPEWPKYKFEYIF